MSENSGKKSVNGARCAFPREGGAGLTKREYFAGLALQAFASVHVSAADVAASGGVEGYRQAVALSAVLYADALLLALDEVKP